MDDRDRKSGSITKNEASMRERIITRFVGVTFSSPLDWFYCGFGYYAQHINLRQTKDDHWLAPQFVCLSTSLPCLRCFSSVWSFSCSDPHSLRMVLHFDDGGREWGTSSRSCRSLVPPAMNSIRSLSRALTEVSRGDNRAKQYQSSIYG